MNEEKLNVANSSQKIFYIPGMLKTNYHPGFALLFEK